MEPRLELLKFSFNAAHILRRFLA